MAWLLAQSKLAREAQIFQKIHAAFIGSGLNEGELGLLRAGSDFRQS